MAKDRCRRPRQGVALALSIASLSVVLTLMLAACGGAKGPSTPGDYAATAKDAFRRHVEENEKCLEIEEPKAGGQCLTRTWRTLYEALDLEPPSAADPAVHKALQDAVGAMLALHERFESTGEWDEAAGDAGVETMKRALSAWTNVFLTVTLAPTATAVPLVPQATATPLAPVAVPAPTATPIPMPTPRSLSSLESEPGNYIFLDSERGDYIGEGIQRALTSADGTFSIVGNQVNGVQIHFLGRAPEGFWALVFAAPLRATLVPGEYEKATRWPFQAPAEPGLSVYGNGRGCNQLTGRFKVLEAAYGPGGEVIRFSAEFEQHCEGGAPALFGKVRFNALTTETPLYTFTPTPPPSPTPATPAESERFHGVQTGPTEWTYTLSYEPHVNYAVCPSPGNIAAITLSGLQGVVSATGPTSTDFIPAGGLLDTVNLQRASEVSDSGTVVTWTHFGPGTGNFTEDKHVFGFKVFTATPAANGTVNVASDGFSGDVRARGCPVQPSDDRDFTQTTNGPVGPANQPPTANSDGLYSVPAAGSVSLNGSGSNPDGAPG